MNIRSWLESVGLPQYADAFEAQEVGVDLLDQLDHATLAELGVGVMGHRLRILRAIRAKAAPPATGAVLRPEPAPRTTWEGERRQVTIMFTDVVGSTQLSTRLDPEDYRDMIRLYHEAVSGAVAEARGHVAQFLGDGAMVYFGYPAAQEDAAERAVDTGLALIEAVRRLEPFPGEPMQLRIGIATGMVVVGDLVGRGLVEEGPLASGETPNLAARLQSLAKPGTIVVSDTTHQLLGRAFRSERLVLQELKGFEGAQTIWRILGRTGVDDRFETHRGTRLSPLLGRDAEMAVLTGGWEHARLGHGSTVLLRGEAGLGKSRLLRELSERAEGARRVQLQSSPYFANTALHPVRRAIEHFAGYERDDGPDERLDKVLKVFCMADAEPDEDGALVAAFMGLPLDRFPRVTISVGLQRARLLQIILRTLIDAAERQPMLFFFEDLHWADPTSIELLGQLIEAAPTAPMLVVATFRHEFEAPWQGGEVTLCDMHRLSPRETAEIITHLSAGMMMPPEIRDTLSTRADGVPLFAEELTKSVLEMRQAGAQDAAAVPATLVDTLMARLDRLSTARRIAQMAAVIGREFEEEILAGISGRPADDVRRSLELLAGAELINRVGESGTWAFHHALIRDAAYDSLLRRSRQELHLKIAEAVEARFPERMSTAPEFVARHYGEAGDAARAGPLWLAAGRVARQRGAVKEALAHVLAGLDQVGRMTPSAERDALEMQLEMTHGYILFAGVSYGSPEAEAAFARAGELSANVTDPDIVTPFHNGYGVHLTMRGDITAGHKELSKLIAVTEDAPHLEIYAAATQAWSNFNRGDFAASAHWGERLEDIVDGKRWNPGGPRHTTGDPFVIGQCFHAASRWALGQQDKAAEMAEAVVDYARTLNDPFSEIYAQVNAVCRIADLRGESARVLEVASSAIDYARRLGYDFAAGYSLFWQARALAETGDPATAIKIITASLAACKAASVRYHEPHFRAMLAVLQARSGDLDAAFGSLSGLEELVERSGERWQAADVRCARAQVEGAAGKAEDAEASWRAALETARELKSLSWELRAAVGLAGALHHRGATAEARDILAPVHARCAEGHATADYRGAAELLARLDQPAPSRAAVMAASAAPGVPEARSRH